MEYALARLWQEWGVQPSAVLGHSIGEYAAACVAGVFELPDALRLVAARGRCMQQLSQGGAMAAVLAPVLEVEEVVGPYGDKVAIAAVNGPLNTVISGERTAVANILNQLQGRGLTCRPLKVSHAFHSPLMEPVLDGFHKIARTLEYAKPRIPLISTLTGAQVEGVPDAEYWTAQIRNTVRFSDAVRSLHNVRVFLEIGPDAVLTKLGKQCSGVAGTRWLSSLSRREPDLRTMLRAAGELYVCGVQSEPQRVFGNQHPTRLAGMPTYAFDRRHFPLPRPLVRPSAPPALRDEGFYAPVWEKVPVRHAPSISPGSTWLVLPDSAGAGSVAEHIIQNAPTQITLTHIAQSEGLSSSDAIGSHEATDVVCLWPLAWTSVQVAIADTSGGCRNCSSGSAASPIGDYVCGW